MSDSISEKEKEVVSNEPKQDDFVSKKAYEGISSDMHKYKARMKEEQARANELESQLKLMAEEKMREQNQYKELFEQKSEELETFRSEAENRRKSYLSAAKKTALKSELGNINDAYLVHAKIEEIQLNDDGTINTESLHRVANDFREKHSVLLPKSSEPTSTSAQAETNVSLGEMTQEQLQEKLSSMSLQEKMEYLKSL
jgi:hypothetical protein